MNYTFFKYNFKNNKNIILYLTKKNFYFLSLHFKLSSLFYSTQLIDLFAYEAPSNSNENSKTFSVNTNVLVYHFHTINLQQRIFIFLLEKNQKIKGRFKTSQYYLNSISELFLNTNWLEREVSELHSIFFSNKKDLRNLMLPYGDTSAPMKKAVPSIGLREIYYDSTTDLLIQTPVSLQF